MQGLGIEANLRQLLPQYANIGVQSPFANPRGAAACSGLPAIGSLGHVSHKWKLFRNFFKGFNRP